MNRTLWLAGSAWVSFCLGTAGAAGAQSPKPAAPTAPAEAASAANVPAAAPAGLIAKGNAEHGKALYQGCAACHSIDENDLGPRHRGVVGRKAGTLPDYNYSPALKASGLTWTEVNLDRWLTNPSDLVPGTKMFFKIDDPQSRADIIAYLEELK